MNLTKRLGTTLKMGGMAMGLCGLGAIAACTPTPNTSALPTPDRNTPDSSVEAIPSLPADAVIVQTALDQVEAHDLCNGFFDPDMAQAESRVHAMGERALVEIVCAYTAYQVVYAYGVYGPADTWQPLTLDVFYPDETGNFVRASEHTIGGLADFDADQGRLTVFSKARGLADCGSLADYRWRGDSLELETFRYQACTDTPEENFVDPSDYPLIYP